MSLENSYLRDGPELRLLNNTVIYKRVRGENAIKEGALNSCQKARETGSCAGVMCTRSSPCLECNRRGMCAGRKTGTVTASHSVKGTVCNHITPVCCFSITATTALGISFIINIT